LTAKPGDTLTLDATGSRDPDQHQTLSYKWWVYPEAGLDGTHGADVTLTQENQPQAKVRVQSACRPGWLPGLIPCRGEGVVHIILQVTDDGTPPLTSYRRVILHVPAEARP